MQTVHGPVNRRAANKRLADAKRIERLKRDMARYGGINGLLEAMRLMERTIVASQTDTK